MECKNCGWEIPSKNINIQLAIAKCGNCNAVFSFYEDLAAPAAASAAEVPGETSAAPPRPKRFADTGLPRGITLEDTGLEVRIRRRWFSPQILILTFFTAVWDLFLLFWFIIAITGGMYGMAAAGIVHFLVGLGLTYYVLAGYLNSTIIAINRDYIVLHHAPLPWRGAKTIGTENVARIYSRGTTSYAVHVLLLDGQDFRLLGGLHDETQALYIEQEAAKYLPAGTGRS